MVGVRGSVHCHGVLHGPLAYTIAHPHHAIGFVLPMCRFQTVAIYGDFCEGGLFSDGSAGEEIMKQVRGQMSE